MDCLNISINIGIVYDNKYKKLKLSEHSNTENIQINL